MLPLGAKWTLAFRSISIILLQEDFDTDYSIIWAKFGSLTYLSFVIPTVTQLKLYYSLSLEYFGYSAKVAEIVLKKDYSSSKEWIL